MAGGKCKVNWKKVCSTTEFGGLGLPNLHLLSRALRLRWLWYEWTAPHRPWVGLPTPCDDGDKELFNSATRVTIGNGNRALFCHSNWLDESPLSRQFPSIFGLSRWKNKTVAQAMINHR